MMIKSFGALCKESWRHGITKTFASTNKLRGILFAYPARGGQRLILEVIYIVTFSAFTIAAKNANGNRGHWNYRGPACLEGEKRKNYDQNIITRTPKSLLDTTGERKAFSSFRTSSIHVFTFFACFFFYLYRRAFSVGMKQKKSWIVKWKLKS